MKSEQKDIQNIISTDTIGISIESAKLNIKIYHPLPPDDPQEAKDGLQRILAYNAWAKQEYEKIIEITSKIKKLNDNDIRILTMSYIRLKNWEKAYAIGKSISATEKETLLALGLVSLFSKKYNQAISFYQHALQGSSNDPEIHARIGEVYYIQRNYSDAILSWEKAIECNRKIIKKRDDLDYLKYFLGIAYYKVNNIKASNQYFSMVEPNEDRFKYAIFFRALYEEKQGDFKAAKTLLHEPTLRVSGFDVIEYYICKERAYVSYVLGFTALSTGERNSALKEFREAARELGTLQINFEEHHLLMILRSIFLRCIEVLDPKDIQNNIIANESFKQLFGLTRSAYDREQIDNNFVLSMAHLFFLMERHDLAAESYLIIFEDFPIAKYNLVALRPLILNQKKIDLPKSCLIPDSAYLLYNFLKALYLNKRYNQTLELSLELESCLNRNRNLDYNIELQIANLTLKSLVLEKIYYNDPAKGVREIQLIKDKIASLTEDYKNTLKVLPPFVEFGLQKDLLILIK